MKRLEHHRNLVIQIALIGLLGLLLFPMTALCQRDETASRMSRFRLGEVSTGYYEGYEVMPRDLPSPIMTPEVGPRPLGLLARPSPMTARIRTHLADAHEGTKFYETKLCEACHPEQARSTHTVRANVTCRRCHGPEPIASINHFFSPVNPIRRHVHVCSKCHAQASESFAAYVIHEPRGMSPEAKERFASLYYSHWLMLILLGGTLGFFIPHSLVVGLREYLAKRAKAGQDAGNEHQKV